MRGWGGTILGTSGIIIKANGKYLGVILGDVIPKQAFAPALQKIFGRDFSMHHYDLSLGECIMLLRLWVLPLVIYPARMIFPLKPVILYSLQCSHEFKGYHP